ncbi:MAG: DUF368 domain-containing protein [Bacteroidetes bacterium]|nr:DUF368 domain-containing protein [Bacteroidota bacterium]
MGNSLLGWITVLGQGLAIGVANVIPGVSGGTMALVFGIYEKLIALLSDLFKVLLALLKLDIPEAKRLLSGVPWAFLIILGVGILTAPVAGAAYIPGLLETWPEHSRSLFFGLILGTIPIPWLRIRTKHYNQFIILLVSTAFSFWIVSLPFATVTDPSLIAVFFSAMLAISAMILPGISGSFVLLVMGMYGPIFAAIDARNIPVVLVFALGCGVGLGSFALALKALLARAHDSTMAALVGLMIGSLRALWPWLSSDRALELPQTMEGTGPILALGALGMVISVGMTLLELKTSSAEKKS